MNVTSFEGRNLYVGTQRLQPYGLGLVLKMLCKTVQCSLWEAIMFPARELSEDAKLMKEAEMVTVNSHAQTAFTDNLIQVDCLMNMHSLVCGHLNQHAFTYSTNHKSRNIGDFLCVSLTNSKF